jgi:hypothetical protein
MNDRTKYICTLNGDFVFFSAVMEHSMFKDFRPISAGYCTFGNNRVTCYGDSHSLKLKSSPLDSESATLQVFGLDAVLTLRI